MGEGWWGKQKVSYIFSFSVLFKEMKVRGQFQTFLLFSPSQEFFTICHRRYGRKSKSKTNGYIYHTNHSTRSPFLHIQLQIKTTLKRRIQLQNRNSNSNCPPAQHPRPHNLPQPRHPLSHWNVKAPSKSQNPQTNQKIISTTSHVTFTYPPKLQQPPRGIGSIFREFWTIAVGSTSTLL